VGDGRAAEEAEEALEADVLSRALRFQRAKLGLELPLRPLGLPTFAAAPPARRAPRTPAFLAVPTLTDKLGLNLLRLAERLEPERRQRPEQPGDGWSRANLNNLNNLNNLMQSRPPQPHPHPHPHPHRRSAVNQEQVLLPLAPGAALLQPTPAPLPRSNPRSAAAAPPDLSHSAAFAADALSVRRQRSLPRRTRAQPHHNHPRRSAWCLG
jgi:hypothetical protein